MLPLARSAVEAEAVAGQDERRPGFHGHAAANEVDERRERRLPEDAQRARGGAGIDGEDRRRAVQFDRALDVGLRVR